jgi:hypothetical protein
MAFPPHIQTAIKLLPHLIECAKTGKRTNYQEMGDAIKMETRMFSRPLAFIRDEICVRHNLPPLTVLVEHKAKIIPANSFAPAQFIALSDSEYKALEQAMIKKVFSYEKWDMALTGLQNMYCAA